MVIPNYMSPKLEVLQLQGINTAGRDAHQAHFSERESCNITTAACQSTKPGSTQVTIAKVALDLSMKKQSTGPSESIVDTKAMRVDLESTSKVALVKGGLLEQ